MAVFRINPVIVTLVCSGVISEHEGDKLAKECIGESVDNDWREMTSMFERTLGRKLIIDG